MNLREFDEFKITDAIHFSDELNPAIFAGDKMKEDVRIQLLNIAEDFIDHLGIQDLSIDDITISGSSAAFSYTKHSDIDLHILVDFNQFKDDDVYRELFDAKKVVYNDKHDITIGGFPVELYVQDSNKPVISLGEYSVLDDSWLKLPRKRRANFDQEATRLKFEKLYKLGEFALRSRNADKIENVLKTIKRYRQAGLDLHGEFGPENLAYKALRTKGIVTKLYDELQELHNSKLSLPENNVIEEIEIDPLEESLAKQFAKFKTDEDYDPNGVPPGPEFKPTMPKGTVRVDVSDVYDWYKLGTHISDLDSADKQVFGKGPPSTIMAFGSEEEEHEYIKNLEKLGLTTTDIDPVDPNQPKNVKRQKTDPTFNVNEASGYIPSEAEKNDPRWERALSVDVHPDTLKKQAKKFGWKTTRAGIPPTLRP